MNFLKIISKVLRKLVVWKFSATLALY